MSDESAQTAENDSVGVHEANYGVGGGRAGDTGGDRQSKYERIERIEQARLSVTTRRLLVREEVPRMRVAETVRVALVDLLVRRNQGRSMPEVMFGTTGRPVAWLVPRRRYHVGVSQGSGAARE